MKETRLHGRGGQGVVKASQMIVRAVVRAGGQGQFIPFFGVERKGSPVYGYLRIDGDPIRRKTQVYYPDILVILDDTLVGLPDTYKGLKDGGTVIINSIKSPDELGIPENAGTIAIVDASGISERLMGKNIPNTAMLGAFARVTGLADKELLLDEAEKTFGGVNRTAVSEGYENVSIITKN